MTCRFEGEVGWVTTLHIVKSLGVALHHQALQMMCAMLACDVSLFEPACLHSRKWLRSTMSRFTESDFGGESEAPPRALRALQVTIGRQAKGAEGALGVATIKQASPIPTLTNHHLTYNAFFS